MPSLFHKSTKYGSGGGSLAYFAQRAYSNEKGEGIDDTYVRDDAIQSIIDNYVASNVMIDKTQIQYDALSSAQKNNGAMYFVTNDNEDLDDTFFYLAQMSQSEYDGLSQAEKTNGTTYFIEDDEPGVDEDFMYMKSITESDYNGLTSAERVDSGTIFLVSIDNTVEIIDIIDSLTFKGEILSSALPASGTAVGEYYFLKDILEGRYWNGTTWKRVL